MKFKMKITGLTLILLVLMSFVACIQATSKINPSNESEYQGLINHVMTIAECDENTANLAVQAVLIQNGDTWTYDGLDIYFRALNGERYAQDIIDNNPFYHVYCEAFDQSIRDLKGKSALEIAEMLNIEDIATNSNSFHVYFDSEWNYVATLTLTCLDSPADDDIVLESAAGKAHDAAIPVNWNWRQVVAHIHYKTVTDCDDLYLNIPVYLGETLDIRASTLGWQTSRARWNVNGIFKVTDNEAGIQSTIYLTRTLPKYSLKDEDFKPI
ncbi:MAG: hypothetical protein CfClM3_0442 [Methanobrevibacter sp. CfCl-M3]